MATTLTVQKRGKGYQGLEAQVLVVFSGSYPANGEPVDWDAAVGFTNRQPSTVIITGKGGFVYQWDVVNSKIIVYCNTAGGADAPLGVHSTGAYAAGVLADVVVAEVRWRTIPSLPAS